MSDDPKDHPARDSSPPPSEGADSPRRRRLEGVIPELLKRAVELGVEKASEAPESLKHLMSDLRLPKEVAAYLFSQVEETKNGMMRVVAKETRDFLEHTNLAVELQKMLTTLQFEINTTIRFRPADAKPQDEAHGEGEVQELPKPEVKMDVFARRAERKRKAKEG